jgi:hypothetical protein
MCGIFFHTGFDKIPLSSSKIQPSLILQGHSKKPTPRVELHRDFTQGGSSLTRIDLTKVLTVTNALAYYPSKGARTLSIMTQSILGLNATLSIEDMISLR